MYRIINIMFNTPANDPDYFQKRSQQLLLSGFPMELLNIDFISDASTFIRWHWHDEIELVYFCEGQVYVTCDEDTILASKGDIVFINHNIKHFLTPTGPEDGLFRSLIINPSFIFGLGQLEMEKQEAEERFELYKNSMRKLCEKIIGAGAEIAGEVTGSVLGPGVVIEEGATSIGDKAFRFCGNLQQRFRFLA